MITQLTTVSSLAPCPVRVVNDVDSSYCSDDDSSSSSTSSSSVCHITISASVPSLDDHGASIENKDSDSKENCVGVVRFHGQGCETCVTRSPDDDDDGSLNGRGVGSDTDGEYDCDDCPTISSRSRSTMSSTQVSSLNQTKLSNRSRCQGDVIRTGSSLYSPCTTWMSSSSRSLSRLSPCSISGLEIDTIVLRLIPGDFMYRGEGNSSLVVSLNKEGKVIRILKDRKKSSLTSFEKNKLPVGDFVGKNGDNSSNISQMDKIKKRLIDIIDFNRHVMKRILNHCFLDEPQLVSLDKSQVELIDRVANVCRPGHRLHKSIPLLDTFALLLPDYCSMKQLAERSSSLPSPSKFVNQFQSRLVGPVISVEIKPKQGFLPSIESLPSDLTIKSSICRFCLKQFHKMKKGVIGGISDYCPLDLFSGCIDRQHLALRSLIKTPQNNLRIFKDLMHVYGDGTAFMVDQSQKTSNEERFGCILQDFITVNKEISCEKVWHESDTSFGVIQDEFCNLLLQSLNHPFLDPQGENTMKDECDILETMIKIDGSTTCQLHLDHGSKCTKGNCCRSKGHSINSLSVLGSVYSAQRLDSVDSYRALEMARYLNDRYPNFMEELKSEHRRPSVIGSPEKLSTESLEDFFFRKVWEFIVSLTAKDCSIMITMQRLNGDGGLTYDTHSGQCALRGVAIIQGDVSKESYLVTTSITDLDPKLPATFADLERKIKEKDSLMVASYNESHTKFDREILN